MIQPEHTATTALIKLIKKAGGKIPLRTYMAFCLNDPLYGYYTTQKPLGKNGDFITAPEISQLFGELLGLWFVNFWENNGMPPKVALLELGPGRGLLMQDMQRAMKIRPLLLDALSIHQVEINPHLKQQQIQAIAPIPVKHHESIDDALKAIGETKTFIVANEFFDAFPLDQYIYKNKAWHKRYVAYNEPKKIFVFHDEVPENAFGNCFFSMKPEEGTVMESAPLVEALFRQITEHLYVNGGAGLIIDYGYDHLGFGDTLQALHHHKKVSPLENPGKVDLTTHVNFATLQRIAKIHGLQARVMPQGEFLKSLGLDLRTQAFLSKTSNAEDQKNLLNSSKRLTDPTQMGTLFKVLQMWR